jgi:hypothetical protein
MIGDSTMVLQYEYFISHKLTTNEVAFKMPFDDLTTHNPQIALDLAYKKWGKIVPIDAVYLNFGALHFLHLFPERVFNFGEYGSKINDKFAAQYLGNINFESWIEREVLFYLQTAKKVILQTPNTICESRFNSVYKEILDNEMEKSYSLCKEWVLSYGRLVSFN